MKLLGFQYDVQARVQFTRAEAAALAKLSGYHYDATCVAAGLQIGEQHPKIGTARENGFLAVLLVQCDVLELETVDATWPFHNFDIALKILEQRHLAAIRGDGVKERMLLDALNNRMGGVCASIQKEHERLTKEARR